MKIFLLMLLGTFVLYANNLDFFDEDVDATFQEKDESIFQTRLRVKYENNSDGSSEKKSAILYQNINGENYYVDYDIATDFDELRVNLKELYYKKKLSQEAFLDIGRINMREGIARGYNSTDYFKGAGLVFDSLVASDRRENRLGSIMIVNTMFWDYGTVKLLYSPKLSTKKDTLWSDKKYFGLGFDITNYRHRASVYADVKLYKDLFSSVIVHNNEEGLHLGTNLSYAINQWIFYNESSVKKAKKSLVKSIDELAFSNDLKSQFNNDEKNIYQGSFGVSYTSQNNIVTTLEYIINSAGMDKKDWKQFFSLNRYQQQLLAARRYHQVNEEMLTQETIFTQISINEVTPELDINILAFINPHDQSALSQISMQYNNKEDLLFRLSARKMFGDLQSEYGSLDSKAIMMAELEYYF